MSKPFATKMAQAQAEGRRLVAPLVGFPGLEMTDSTIKLAQQNYGEHFRVVKALTERYMPDVIFPLMDLSVEANALGHYTLFPKEESATVVKQSFSFAELTRRRQINFSFDTRLLGYVETVKLMGVGLPDGILRGAYVTGPYSLAALLMGADDAAMATILDPDGLRALCQFATDKIQEYVRLLIAAGADVICILEPSAVMLGPDMFWQFSGAFVQHINRSCQYTDVATVYHTCGNTTRLVAKMVESGVDAVSLDSPMARVHLPELAKTVPEEVVLMGNINPTGTILNGTPDEVAAEVTGLMDEMAPYSNFVLSTGCDLPQTTPLDNIAAFMDAGRAWRA